jgi:hypothetical protein
MPKGQWQSQLPLMQHYGADAQRKAKRQQLLDEHSNYWEQ